MLQNWPSTPNQETKTLCASYGTTQIMAIVDWQEPNSATGNTGVNTGVRAAATLNYSLSKQRNLAGPQQNKSCLLPGCEDFLDPGCVDAAR